MLILAKYAEIMFVLLTSNSVLKNTPITNKYMANTFTVSTSRNLRVHNSFSEHCTE